MFSLKWMDMTLSIPKTWRIISARSSAEFMSGHLHALHQRIRVRVEGEHRGDGCFSAARRFVISSSAAWPMWTPSKKPRAILSFCRA